MKYIYILLICLILFYIISRYFEKYYSQENFDPSLVPVSSIITLAKVAQKIVDGNGTLTNPANLNIGTPTGKGNLLVTGNSTTNGNKQIDGTLGVTGATTLSNTLGVTGVTTLSNTLGVTGATTLSTLGVNGATTFNGNTTFNGAATIGAIGTPAATTKLTVNGATAITGNTTVGALTVNGATAITGNTTVGGTLIVTGNTTLGNTNINGTTTSAHSGWHKSSEGANRLYYGNNSHTYIGSPDQWNFQNAAGTNVVSIDKLGAMTINNVKIEKFKGQYNNSAAYTKTVYDNPSGTYPYFIKIVVINSNASRYNQLEAMTFDSTSTPWVMLGAYNSGDPAIKYNVNNVNAGLWTLSGGGDNNGPYYWYVTVER